MKAGVVSVAVALTTLAVAQPHGGHQHVHRRDEVVTQVVAAPAVGDTVFVDQDGNPISTSFAAVQHQATPAPYQAPQNPPAYSPPPYNPEPAPAPAPEPPSHGSGSDDSHDGGSGSSDGSSSGKGIVYSPYNADHTCKSQSEVNSDFEKINGYSLVRMYGTDCNQASTVLNAAKKKNMKIFAGIWDLDNVAAECSTLVAAVGGDWSSVDTVGIGNEVVNKGGSGMVPKVVSALGQAKGILKAAGYNGPVVAPDTFIAIQKNPEICHASDYAAANAHAFFDPNTSADEAGDWALKTAQDVSSACGGKKTVITESGWPSQGSANGKAVPSPENQKKAVDGLKSKFSSNLIIYSAFNQMWKEDFSGSFGCEKFWGVLGG